VFREDHNIPLFPKNFLGSSSPLFLLNIVRMLVFRHGIRHGSGRNVVRFGRRIGQPWRNHRSWSVHGRSRRRGGGRRTRIGRRNGFSRIFLLKKIKHTLTKSLDWSCKLSRDFTFHDFRPLRPDLNWDAGWGINFSFMPLSQSEMFRKKRTGWVTRSRKSCLRPRIGKKSIYDRLLDW